MSDATERWLPVLDWEGFYEVSDLGRVRSLDRMVLCSGGHSRTYRGRILRPCPNVPGGHLYVTLSAPGYKVRLYVHQLVAAAFIGPCPPGEEVRHWDGDPANNRRSNLLYGTRTENMEDMVRHGRAPTGSRHGRSILTEADVIAIRAAWQQGTRVRDLAARYGVSSAGVGLIVNGHNWRDLPVLQRAPGTCRRCGAQFERRYVNRIYCTKKCKEAARYLRRRQRS